MHMRISVCVSGLVVMFLTQTVHVHSAQMSVSTKMCVFTGSAESHVQIPPPVFWYGWQICCLSWAECVLAILLPCSWIQAYLSIFFCWLFWLLHVFVLANIFHCVSTCPGACIVLVPVNVSAALLKVEWWCELHTGASSGLIGRSLSQEIPADLLSFYPPMQFHFLLGCFFFSLKRPFLISANKWLIWAKILKSLFISRLDGVCMCVYMCCPKLVTWQQQE